ncbi:MAG: hypothetical protein M1815_004557 [Lichina confinis]|nr:MAG: hypothetical protein M1815_004557 [Lichina confinis]
MTDVEVKYFETIPWCAKLLNDPDFVFFPTPSRRRKESTEDALFGETLKTDATIRACVSLYRRPERSGGAQIEEVRTLFALGDGVNGYPHSCHGGIVATIVDEVMGLLISVNRDMEDLTATVVTLTASLNVVYLKPVETP